MATAEDRLVPKALIPFQGAWAVSEMEVEGSAVTEADRKQTAVRFDGAQIIVDSPQKKGEKGSVEVNPEYKPGWFDLKLGAAETVRGVYKFEKDGGRLTICYPKDPKTLRPAGFVAPENSGLVVVVLERPRK